MPAAFFVDRMPHIDTMQPSWRRRIGRLYRSDTGEVVEVIAAGPVYTALRYKCDNFKCFIREAQWGEVIVSAPLGETRLAKLPVPEELLGQHYTGPADGRLDIVAIGPRAIVIRRMDRNRCELFSPRTWAAYVNQRPPFGVHRIGVTDSIEAEDPGGDR
jgi:hypothetical protein